MKRIRTSTFTESPDTNYPATLASCLIRNELKTLSSMHPPPPPPRPSSPAPRRELPRALADRRRGRIVHPEMHRLERFTAPRVAHGGLAAGSHLRERQVHPAGLQRGAPAVRVRRRRGALPLRAIGVRHRLCGRRRAGPRATPGVSGRGRSRWGWFGRCHRHRWSSVGVARVRYVPGICIGRLGVRRRLFLRSERRVDPRTPVNAVNGTEMWSASIDREVPNSA